MSSLPHTTTPSDPLRLASQHSNSPPDHLLFNPPPDIASAILQDLADPFKSFGSIAQSRGTTIEGLTLWMQRPSIARRLDALESASTRRSRLQASGYLPLCVDALARAITGFSRDESQTTPLPSNPKLDEQRRKARETLLRMTRVMMQLSKFQHAPAKPAKSASASPVARAANPAAPRTTNPPSPTRTAANPAPLDVERPERQGDTAPPRTGPANQSHHQSQADSGGSRTHQSAQPALSSV
jgi:hypothetical protein